MIALALSGGGSRAIAFHLGCLRALADRGVLERVSVISAVSGGSFIAALYAYTTGSFDEFDKFVQGVLRTGLQRAAVGHLFSPKLVARVAATNLISWPVAAIARLVRAEPPFRRWASRTDALELALADHFGDRELSQVARPNLNVVFNACELRTGTAFRFGNQRSGNWRFGELPGNRVALAHAVACSAAYPMLLPAFDRQYTFQKGSETKVERVIITDGGIYDNLGINCLEPGRQEKYSLHVFRPDYIICCHAGYGQFSGERIPYGFYSRVATSFEFVFRKAQDAAVNRLHAYAETGRIRGFILPYLGQQDGTLPINLAGLVTRDEVIGYPTDFAGMSEENMTRLSKRGEQLTRILLQHYCPEI
jgi:NTE family protein